MEFTMRGLWTMLHGMAFGALYLLACSGAIVELMRPCQARAGELKDDRFLRNWVVGMAVLAWLTVLSGTYILYPWYRAVPPVDASLAAYPQALLKSSASTAAWHAIGMEWKEHVAWLVPICITMAAAVGAQYGSSLRRVPHLRNAVLAFVLVSFGAAGVAGFFGAMLNKHAPLEGGGVIHPLP